MANVTIGGLLLDLGPEVGVLAVNAEDLESILGILAGSIRNQVKQKFRGRHHCGRVRSLTGSFGVIPDRAPVATSPTAEETHIVSVFFALFVLFLLDGCLRLAKDAIIPETR